MNNSNHQHHQPPDFLSPQGRQRYHSIAGDLMNELTAVRNSQRTRKHRITAASCTIILIISGTWIWSALYQSSTTAPIARQAPETETKNNTTAIQTEPSDQPHSYFVQISKSHSTLVKTYTTAEVKADPVIKIEPLTDDALIELFRKSGKQVGLIETQGKTIITGDIKITRFPSDDTTPRTPISNATHIRTISTSHNALCLKYIKTNHHLITNDSQQHSQNSTSS